MNAKKYFLYTKILLLCVGILGANVIQAMKQDSTVYTIQHDRLTLLAQTERDNIVKTMAETIANQTGLQAHEVKYATHHDKVAFSLPAQTSDENPHIFYQTAENLNDYLKSSVFDDRPGLKPASKNSPQIMKFTNQNIENNNNLKTVILSNSNASRGKTTRHDNITKTHIAQKNYEQACNAAQITNSTNNMFRNIRAETEAWNRLTPEQQEGIKRQEALEAEKNRKEYEKKSQTRKERLAEEKKEKQEREKNYTRGQRFKQKGKDLLKKISLNGEESAKRAEEKDRKFLEKKEEKRRQEEQEKSIAEATAKKNAAELKRQEETAKNIAKQAAEKKEADAKKRALYMQQATDMVKTRGINLKQPTIKTTTAGLTQNSKKESDLSSSVTPPKKPIAFNKILNNAIQKVRDERFALMQDAHARNQAEQAQMQAIRNASRLSYHGASHHIQIPAELQPIVSAGKAVLFVGEVGWAAAKWVGGKIFGSSNDTQTTSSHRDYNEDSAEAKYKARIEEQQRQIDLLEAQEKKAIEQAQQEEKKIAAEQRAAGIKRRNDASIQSLTGIQSAKTQQKNITKIPQSPAEQRTAGIKRRNDASIKSLIESQKAAEALRTTTIQRTQTNNNDSVFNPLGMEGFKTTTLDEKSITTSIAQTKRSIEGYKAASKQNDHTNAVYATVTHFNQLTERCVTKGMQQLASNFSHLSSQLMALEKKLNRGSVLVAQGIQTGVRNAQKKTEQLVHQIAMNPGKAAEELALCTGQVTLTIVEMLLEQDAAMLNPGLSHRVTYQRPEALRNKIAADLKSFNDLPRHEKVKTAVSFVTEQFLLGAGGAATQESLYALASAANSGRLLGLAETNTRKSIANVLIEAAEIKQCLASKGVEEATLIINTIKGNPKTIAQAGSAAKAVENVANGKVAKSVQASTPIGNLSNQSKSQLLKSKKSYEKLIQEHKKKLDDYINNPDYYDNKGLLKNTSLDRREKIIKGRIIELEKQIKKQQGQLNNINNFLN